jgi:hypothetical protein
MKPTTFAECMDVFDWFDDALYEYLNHIWLSKLDADVRIARALPKIIDRAAELIAAHEGTEVAYPVKLLNQPA